MNKHRHPQDRVSNDIHHNKPDHQNPTKTPSQGTTKPRHPNPAEAHHSHHSPGHPNSVAVDTKPDTPNSVAVDTKPDDFSPAEALQHLHLEVVQLEALANAASEAVVQLPFPSGRDARRVFDRVYALVTKVADETGAVVSLGDELVAALAAYQQRRPKES